MPAAGHHDASGTSAAAHSNLPVYLNVKFQLLVRPSQIRSTTQPTQAQAEVRPGGPGGVTLDVTVTVPD